MPAYNKLVRDRIPEIIKNDGKTPKTRILNGEEYRFELLKKIVEEAQEVAAAPDKNELAKELGDVLEVVDAIIKANGLDGGEVARVKNERCLSRGAFEKRTFLESAD
jgi:predicted house-cleaning noncanonical NTP pyrophosphatase (MazG superfamily)